jgi:DNA-binding transcriptional MerR regulator
MLRDLGLGIPAIAELLNGEGEDARALASHLHWLRGEKDRLDRQIASVERTIQTMEEGEQLMAEEMFDGFDHTEHRAEVEDRWGAQAYADGDRWWRSKSPAEKSEWQARQKLLAADWSAAAAAGLEPGSAEAQALAARHAEWLSGIPGTPQLNGRPAKLYFVGLSEMYVADERFAANYGGVDGARFVRDAMALYAKQNL